MVLEPSDGEVFPEGYSPAVASGKVLGALDPGMLLDISGVPSTPRLSLAADRRMIVLAVLLAGVVWLVDRSLDPAGRE